MKKNPYQGAMVSALAPQDDLKPWGGGRGQEVEDRLGGQGTRLLLKRGVSGLEV